MDCAVLANHVVIPDLDARIGIRIEAKVLREGSDDCSVTDAIVFSNANGTGDHGVPLNLCAGTDQDGPINQGIRSDGHIGVKLRLWIDSGTGMNHPDY